jgi:hypothetical protein
MGGLSNMMPVIEVQCPFCKATGQIMTPPLGSIIVGPCPRCNETVLLFDGTVMALDKDIIKSGTPEEKKQHLLETIIDMVAEKVEDLVDTEDLGGSSRHSIHDDAQYSDDSNVTPSIRDAEAPQISREDVRDFVNIDLHLIDSKNYFDKVFRKKRGSGNSNT